MQLSHLIQWKLPARWSGNRAYARWVMLFIRLLWKGPMEPCTFFVSLSDSQSDKGNRNENAHICKNRAHFTDLLKYHPSGKYSWPRSKSASQHVFPLFFFLVGGKCDTIEPAFCVLALGFYFGYAPRFNGTQLVSTWKSATWVYNLWNWALSNRRFVGRMPCTRLTYMIGF